MNKEKITCQCGAYILQSSLKRHYNSLKHQAYENKIKENPYLLLPAPIVEKIEEYVDDQVSFKKVDKSINKDGKHEISIKGKVDNETINVEIRNETYFRIVISWKNKIYFSKLGWFISKHMYFMMNDNFEINIVSKIRDEIINFYVNDILRWCRNSKVKQTRLPTEREEEMHFTIKELSDIKIREI
jgi:hypothetical protein